MDKYLKSNVRLILMLACSVNFLYNIISPKEPVSLLIGALFLPLSIFSMYDCIQRRSEEQ